jgi:hypothetical protein
MQAAAHLCRRASLLSAHQALSAETSSCRAATAAAAGALKMNFIYSSINADCSWEEESCRPQHLVVNLLPY